MPHALRTDKGIAEDGTKMSTQRLAWKGALS